MKTAIGLLAVAALTLSASAQNVIFDNGPPDGSNGFSAGDFDFGWRQAADDFILGDEYPYWNIEDAHFSVVWYYGGGLNYVSEVLVEFYEDTGAGPAVDPMAVSPGVIPIASQYYTGQYFFDREEVAYDLEFDCVELPAGTTFWVSFTMLNCPENAFWLCSAQGAGNIFGNEAYVWMDDYGYPKWTPSSYAFGDVYDMSFYLTGYGIPTPGALALLGLAGLVRRRRR
ncbi:MAG: hypothetical protein JSV91_13775 [Phycisphaerales bacterium]|nr:MAG: hypothetical protein JSV91_13775 [Phycisphaerales bacterium]